ncbi:hypothetical protein GCM10009789_71890 [Kribbella sancticallisti]|uniref:Uncharacterized protein n=1 Tax=Kribbella sancticallisti TaxID=460087 RepID=A0ABN2EHS5_9ACTN
MADAYSRTWGLLISVTRVIPITLTFNYSAVTFTLAKAPVAVPASLYVAEIRDLIAIRV